LGDLGRPAEHEPQYDRAWNGMKPTGQLQYFHSKIDGTLVPCAVCATDMTDEPKPLIVEVSPGAMSDLPGCVAQAEGMARVASEHGLSCVVLRATGRGSGSVYQHYGEIDVFEAIEHVKEHFAIDEDRISVTGASMGGAATWYLISHYPDVFAAAAPFCGYCDYRLWEKPGGATFHMHEWEEPSWRSRSAALLIENLAHTKVWMVHGEWDRGVGGGVPVEHSRQMVRLFEAAGYDFRYTEVPETGHSCRLPEVVDEVVPWLLRQQKERDPERVAHAAFTLRHNRSHWVSIEQFEVYDRKAMVDARINGTAVEVSTENVTSFALAPRHVEAELTGLNATVTVDGTGLAGIDFSAGAGFFTKDAGGAWQQGRARGKRHGASGPIGDLFFDGTLLVPGSCGSRFETHVMGDMAADAATFYRSRNGGVHRGGIPGDNTVTLRVCDDADLTVEERRQHNLILYGTHSSNSVLRQYGESIPITFEEDCIRIRDKEYRGESYAAVAIFPHPEHDQRYVAVHGGTTEDAICWGSHLDMALLPDYLVYAKGEVIEWGFWDSEWR